MAVLREVIAHFGVKVDDKSLKKLDKDIDFLKDKFDALGRVGTATFAAGAFGAYKFVEAASAADEALNVLQVTFGKQSDQVLNWSKVVGGEMSRSMYEMQDAVGRFGAFLEPQFKGSTTDIAAMSMALTQLSVDLASFYNMSDQESAMRLFSGISGETEAVRRLGIDISDTALDAFNKAYGDESTKKKRMAALTLQEKTLLRYKKILTDTSAKQGDAVRTAGSWANQVKDLQGKFHEMSVEWGRKLLPHFKAMLPYLEQGLKWADEMANKTTLFKDTMIAAAAAIALANGKSALLYGSLFAVSAVAQDIVGFSRDQDSLFGHWLEQVTELKNPLQALKETLQDMVGYSRNLVASTILFYHLQRLYNPLFRVPAAAARKIERDKLLLPIESKEHEQARFKRADELTNILGGMDKKDPKYKKLNDELMSLVHYVHKETPEERKERLAKLAKLEKRQADETDLYGGHESFGDFMKSLGWTDVEAQAGHAEKARRDAQTMAVLQNKIEDYVSSRDFNTDYKEAQDAFLRKRVEAVNANPRLLDELDLKRGTNYMLDTNMSEAPVGLTALSGAGYASGIPLESNQSIDPGPIALPSAPISYVDPAAALMSGGDQAVILNQKNTFYMNGAQGSTASQAEVGMKKAGDSAVSRFASAINTIKSNAPRRAKAQ